MRVQSLGWDDLLEEKMATHSSILAWEVPWTGEPEWSQSMWSQKSHTRLSDRACRHRLSTVMLTISKQFMDLHPSMDHTEEHCPRLTLLLIGGQVAKILCSRYREPRFSHWSESQIPHASTKDSAYCNEEKTQHSQINKYYFFKKADLLSTK